MNRALMLIVTGVILREKAVIEKKKYALVIIVWTRWYAVRKKRCALHEPEG